jgi:hypothetical protein
MTFCGMKRYESAPHDVAFRVEQYTTAACFHLTSTLCIKPLQGFFHKFFEVTPIIKQWQKFLLNQ